MKVLRLISLSTKFIPHLNPRGKRAMLLRIRPKPLNARAQLYLGGRPSEVEEKSR